MRTIKQWLTYSLFTLPVLYTACGAPVDSNSDEQVQPLEEVVALTEVPLAPTEVAEEAYTVLDSGLKIHDFKVGTGETPVRGSKVSVHYTGWLADGTQFDSSVSRGQPFDFRLETGAVIQGWHLGVAGMKVGGHRQLVIPSELGYGEQAKGKKIPANSILVFEIQLLAIGNIRVPPESMPTATNWTPGADGLQIVDLKLGEGKEVFADSAVQAEVTMWLDNGEFVFSTYQGEKAIPFIQGTRRVLPGWDLGSLGMKAGGSRFLKIPSTLAFGERGRGTIGPNATVFVQMDIVKVGAPRHVPEVLPSFKVEEMTTTETGLQFLDTELGTGGSVTKGQMVSVEYTGWLEDGTMFDSSFKQPDALKFPLGQGRVIKGWDQGIASMQIGGKRLLRIKPDLAYGEKGSPPVIPPNSTLIFQVELKEAL